MTYGVGTMPANRSGPMETSTTSTHPSVLAPKKRGRKPKNPSQQALADAERLLKAAQHAKEKALAAVEKEQQAELAKQGRINYLRWIEQMHPAERDLHVTPCMQLLSPDQCAAIQAWLALLAR